MRQVIQKSTQDNVIDISEVSENQYFGVIFPSREKGDNKGFITQSFYQSGDFQVRTTDNITLGNGFSYPNDRKCKSLAEIIQVCLENNPQKFKKAYTVYCFDTYQELFRWLAE